MSVPRGINRHSYSMPLVKDMQEEDRPREKFAAYGGQALGMEELLAILLRTGVKGQSAIQIGRHILASCGGAAGLNHVSVPELMQVRGVGEDKAITLCAAIELGRRLSQVKVQKEYQDFSQSSAVGHYMMERLRHEREEHVCLVLLNTRNELIRVETISIGGLSSSLVEQRSVFRMAIKYNAAALILVHNHPSGMCQPSQKDIEITHLYQKAGVLMGIPVLDHVIIGDQAYYSLAEHGYLQAQAYVE